MASDQVRASRLRALEDRLRALREWDVSVETDILHELVGPVSTWPADWRRMTFVPTENVSHAAQLTEHVLPGWGWFVGGPDGGRPCGVTERSVFRPMPVTRRGLFSPAANLVAAVLLALAARLDGDQRAPLG